MSNPDLKRYLAELPDALERELSGVIRGEAEGLADAQRAALRTQLQVPDDSGDLEGSIRVEDGEHALEFFVRAGGNATNTEIRDGSGTDFDYGAAFEFGTSKQPARPFFYSTYRERSDGIRDRIAKAVERILR